MNQQTQSGELKTIACILVMLLATPAVQAQEAWRFGIGTGFSSFSLDGDIGFATPGGGVIADVDLDNSDTSDLIESGFGAAGFATKGPWTINLAAGTMTLEDSGGGLDAEWDRTLFELSATYRFAVVGKNAFGALFGVLYTDHDWDISTATDNISPGDDWTDAIIGLTHALPFSERWSWSNLVHVGFGDSEEATYLKTAVNWQPAKNWIFNVSASVRNTEFGDSDDIGDSDFYFYDIEEPAFGLGFAYTW